MTVDKTLLSRLEPVCHLTLEHQNEIAAMSRIEQVSQGRDILHFTQSSNRAYYLVSGELKLAYTDGSESIIRPETEPSRYPIGSGRTRIAAARVLSDAEILVVDSDLIDVIMTWEQVPGYPGTKAADDAMFPAGMNFLQTAGIRMDAVSLFGVNKLQGGAFSRLPSANIDELYRRMVSMVVTAGQVIIKQGEEGDFYYLIESGRARVTRTSSPGEAPVVIAQLAEGDAFGEEAPVSDNRRNATVTMETNGTLLKLSKQDFIELLKAPLLNSISRELAEQKITEGANWIDVRLPSEFSHDHLPDAINLPLHEIRDAPSQLSKKQAYISYCKTGRRSAAAAFIMSQMGFDVYVLAGGTQGGGEQ